MARPRAENYDQVKADIIDAAAKVFAEKGFHGANIIDIGKASGASKSRMYHYFASKEAILLALVQGHVEGLLELASEVARSSLPPARKLARFLEVHLQYYLAHREKHAVLLNDVDNLERAQRATVSQLERKLAGLLAHILAQLNPPRFAEPAVAKVHAMLIYGMINWTYTWYRPNGPVSPDALAKHVARLCVEGIGPAR
jgi:AcrR family transcriptional regulator